MTLFTRLVNRGKAILREWYDLDGVDTNNQRMIAELTAASLVAVAGDNMKNWTPQERAEKVNTLRIALTSAFQIGRHTAPIKEVTVA